MKKITVLITIFLFFSVSSVSSVAKIKAGKDDIRLNQLGYYPKAAKTVVVVDSSASLFTLRDKAGNDVYKAKLTDRGWWELSGENIKTGDFSSFKRPGTYTIYVKDKGVSHEFEIKSHLYREALKASLKSYYFHRVSMELEEKYAGKWRRPMGHPDTKCLFHPSSGYTSGYMSSPGGWYDAGDYNKYVVNAGVTVGIMLSFYELFPEIFPDNSINIPESGNGVSDLLDELKYELDWVITMQDKDGGVFFKLTSKDFTGFIMPHRDTTQRYVVGKSTASTLNLAAMTAQAARVFKSIDKAYAARCLDASKKAFQWAIKNNKRFYTNPPDIKTGEYGDKDLEEETFWAATQLMITTGDQSYLPYVEAYIDKVENRKTESWRFFLDELGTFSLSTLPDTKQPKLEHIKQKAIQVVLRLADEILKEIERIPYRIPKSHFVWASNGDMADDAVILAYAYIHTGKRKYLDGISETVDYLFGKNATSYSFLTGFGDKPPQRPHQRLSGSDGIAEPLPGFLVGGPNKERQDDIEVRKTYGVKYPKKEPARSYVDGVQSYASNEVCINWNAPLVFILGFLESNEKALH
jgi:endoglucanase